MGQIGAVSGGVGSGQPCDDEVEQGRHAEAVELARRQAHLAHESTITWVCVCTLVRVHTRVCFKVWLARGIGCCYS